MSRDPSSEVPQNCPGPIGGRCSSLSASQQGNSQGNLPRRELLRLGLGGFASLSLMDLLAMRANAAPVEANGPVAKASTEKPTAIILVWLRGGISHLDSFDPKPNAPSEYRGPFQAVPTNVPGIHVSELVPELAKMADRYAIVRSLAQTGPGHPSGTLQMFSGDPDAPDKLFPRYPDWMSVASKLRSGQPRDLPIHVAVNPIDYYDNFKIAGSTYLGPQYEPFAVKGDPNLPNFAVPNLGLSPGTDASRIRSRLQLQQQLDSMKREVDYLDRMQAIDKLQSQAVDMVLNPRASEAFDLTREKDATRDRYGRHTWGQQCLLARRLIEAGVEIVTTEFDGPLCGRVKNWDDHAVNHHVFDALRYRMAPFDQAVSALIEDIYARGMDQRVLVVVTGEFGRTPRISYDASTGAGVCSGAVGVMQPGRDHWPQAGSMLFAGGGIETGQVIGATDARGEEVIEGRVGPEDFLATIYRHLQIDYNKHFFHDFAGRPTPIIREGKEIAGLARRG
ncbi:MAG: DUF1501 domain-containing protein [Planctomycetota bacterium]|nr:DUF1501 domain-containing protein [Planctomycetota bacterium]